MFPTCSELNRSSLRSTPWFRKQYRLTHNCGNCFSLSSLKRSLRSDPQDTVLRAPVPFRYAKPLHYTLLRLSILNQGITLTHRQVYTQLISTQICCLNSNNSWAEIRPMVTSALQPSARFAKPLTLLPSLHA